MNLVLARECSNSCPYCFEISERDEEKQNFISMENISKFATWARESGLQYLSLLGGEPFLHPKITDIIRIFRDVCPTMALQIFTGGVIKSNLLDKISAKDVGLIFNVNEPRDYRNYKQFTQVINNIETAIRKGFFVVLGFNVWREDFDISFIPKLAYDYGRTHFRWTVANPQWNYQLNVVKPDNYTTLSKSCFDMLQEAASLNILAELDCPLPLCFFDESQLAWISQYHGGTASRMGCCEPVLDVTPELEVIRCFALSELTRVNINEFPNENSIWHWFMQQVDFRLLPEGCFKNCGNCQHFNNGRCNGGCLAWHKSIVDLKSENDSIKLTNNMEKAIKSGEPLLALEHYKKANHWSKTTVPKYAAALAAFNLGKYKQAFRYAALAQDLATNPDLRMKIAELMEKIPAIRKIDNEDISIERITTNYISNKKQF